MDKNDGKWNMWKLLFADDAVVTADAEGELSHQVIHFRGAQDWKLWVDVAKSKEIK